MHSKRWGEGAVSLSVLLVGLFLAGMLTGIGEAADTVHADINSKTTHQITRDGSYMRGGFALLNPASGVPAYSATTAATYESGVYMISWYNAGSVDAFILLGSGVASNTNYSLILPPSGTFLSRTQNLVTTVSVAAAATTSIFAAW